MNFSRLINKIFLFISSIILIFLLSSSDYFAQKKDKAIFKEQKPGYFENSILKNIKLYEEKQKKEHIPAIFKTDYSNYDLPTSIEQYKTFWHKAPVSQGNSGTCWCFSATSFFESEVYRLTGKEVKLSEMFTVYWEYFERAKSFVQTRGKTYFAQGSEANAIPRMWKIYGIVPYNDFPGRDSALSFYNHRNMFEEMNNYLLNVKKYEQWNEKKVGSTIKSILNKYIGEPPAKINVQGKEITPKEYLKNILKLRMNDYFSFISLKEETYYEKHELVEPDNWWHSDNYYNVPLDDFVWLIKKSIGSSNTISICGDVSEAGYDTFKEVAMIPTFDIPSEYIDEDARQFRLSNKSTTDDHCVHIIGYLINDGKYWFLVKDSSSGAFNGTNKGYFFYNEDYIKLKMMNIFIHKDNAKEILDKIIK